MRHDAWAVLVFFVELATAVAASSRGGGASAADLAAKLPAPAVPGVDFLSWGFENASPLQWESGADGALHVHLLYDYERNSPNRAAGHWHFQIHGKPGTELTLVLDNFDNVYNGRHGAAVCKKTICFLSPDGKRWKPTGGELLEGSRLRLKVRLEGDRLHLARLEPYRISDLDRFLDQIRGNPLVEITGIGKTVEGRPLEIVRVGRPEAPFRVLLRARAHAWETGGNWAVQGLVRGLLQGDETAGKCLARFCLYVMPMANKDGVARGWTRFNSLGKDLNRNWDKPADPHLAPENHALETWIQGTIRQGRPLHFAMDLHNDDGGGLHLSRPPVKDLAGHLDRMKRFEELLRKRTWFTEGVSGPGFRNAGTFGEGLLERYGIDACILEFNGNWIAGLNRHPSGETWEQFGKQLREVFLGYFASLGP